jgi:serine/threonine protein kinase
MNFPLYKRFKEKDSDYNDKKININSSPSDIINASMLDSEMDNIIENEQIKKDKSLYDSIQTKIKKILLKGHLPIFNIDNYKIEKQIGEGSFGLIYQVTNKKNYIKYAMKKIIANNLIALEAFQAEFEIVHQNSHPNILNILGICIRCLDQTTYVIYVLMDLALHDWDFEIEERTKQKKYYTEKELITILKQISSALFYLQRVKKIAHRDVKPENILVFNDGIYKLGDFGEAKINRFRRNNARSTIRGTEMYMSPALFNALQDNKDDIQHDIYKSDVFSLGYCFIYAAVLDFKILEDIRTLNNDFKVKKILQRVLFLRYSPEFIDLLYKMITIKEEDRIDFIGLEKLLKEKKF